LEIFVGFLVSDIHPGDLDFEGQKRSQTNGGKGSFPKNGGDSGQIVGLRNGRSPFSSPEYGNMGSRTDGKNSIVT